jgi:ATP-dependent helicase/nuclease subunit A
VVSRYPSRPAIDPWSALKETLEMQLELDEVSVEPVQAEPLLQAPNVAGNAKTVGDWLRTAAEPTFTRTSVTAETKSASDGGPHRAGGGGGMVFGTVVHRCLEALGTGEVDEAGLEEYVRAAATEEELEDKWLPEALGTIRNVLQHEVWQRGERAKRKVHEFSFTVAQPSTPVTSIVNGVIDYLYEEEDGWVIVDFKTDTFAPEHEAEFIAYYKPQVLAYAAQWERFGYKVKEVGLWFLKGNKYVQVK